VIQLAVLVERKFESGVDGISKERGLCGSLPDYTVVVFTPGGASPAPTRGRFVDCFVCENVGP